MGTAISDERAAIYHLEREHSTQEYGMGKKIEKKMEAKKTRKLPESQQVRSSKKKPQAEEEPEETRPLSLVYNQERYPAHYDLSRWNDLAINFGYKAFSFRT